MSFTKGVYISLSPISEFDCDLLIVPRSEGGSVGFDRIEGGEKLLRGLVQSHIAPLGGGLVSFQDIPGGIWERFGKLRVPGSVVMLSYEPVVGNASRHELLRCWEEDVAYISAIAESNVACDDLDQVLRGHAERARRAGFNLYRWLWGQFNVCIWSGDVVGVVKRLEALAQSLDLPVIDVTHSKLPEY